MINLNKYKFCILLLSFISFADDLNSKSLNEIFSIAVDSASVEPNVVAGKSDILSAEAELSASRRARLPVFNASIINSLTIDRKISDQSSLRKLEDEGLDLRLQLVQPIFTGFKIQSDINRNRARLSGFSLESQKIFSETIIESIIAYMNYSRAINLKSQFDNTLKRAKEIFELEKMRYNAGATDLTIFSQARVKLSEIQLLSNIIQSELIESQAIFNRFYPNEAKPIEKLESFRNFDFKDVFGTNESYELGIARVDLDAAQADLLKARGDRLPSIALTVSGVLYDVDGSDQEDDEYDIEGGLQANWQILDFGANRKRVSSKNSIVKASKYRITYQKRIDEVQKLSLLSSIASLKKQLDEQYNVLDDLDSQSSLMEAQLKSSNFSGIALMDLLYQRDQIQRSIDYLEGQYIEANLRFKLIYQELIDFVIRESD